VSSWLPGAHCYLSVFRKAPAMAANTGIDAVRPMSPAMGCRENFIAQIADMRTIIAKVTILFFMPAMLSRS
jgi:hypothetical protein